MQTNAETHAQIIALGQRWAEAQERGDTEVLESLLTSDFTLVGPLGFVLDKQQWLGQYRSGALVTHSMALDEVEVRDYGDAAIAIGRVTQHVEYQGQPANGRLRVTQIAIRAAEDWLLAGVHFSQIAEPK
jgi:ketosteroid isomerase-like protein